MSDEEVENTQPEQPHVFEIGDDSEWDNFVNWANQLDGGPSALPNDIRVGDVIIRRLDGRYQVYRQPEKDVVTEAAVDPRYFDVERTRLRLQIFQSCNPGERGGKSQLERAKEVESWIFSGSDTSSNG